MILSKFMRFIVVSLFIICVIPFARAGEKQSGEIVTQLEKSLVRKGEFNFETGLKSVVDYISQNPDIMGEYDTKLGLVDPISGLRVDLFVYDYLDEVSFLFHKRRYQRYREEFKKVVNHQPVENFPKIYEFLLEKSEQDQNLKGKLKKIIPQLYGFDGKALPVEREFLKKGRFKRLAKIRRINAYNKVAFDPEAVNLQRFLRDQSFWKHYVTPGLTVSKFRKLKKSHLKNLIKAYRDAYQVAFLDGYLSKDTPDLEVSLKSKKMNGQSNIVLHANSEASEVTKKEVTPIFNEIYKSSSKYEIFGLIESSLGIELPRMRYQGRRFPVLTPGIIYTNLDDIKVLLRDFTWDFAIESGNDQILRILRKWMKENRDEIESRIKLSKYYNGSNQLTWKDGELPKRDFTLAIYSDLEEKFPDSPWIKNDSILDENGKRIRVSRNRILKTLRFLGGQFKELLSFRSLISMGAASALMVITGNPFVSSAAASLSYDLLYAKTYGYRLSKYLKRNSIQNLGTSLVLATGFQSGRLARSVVMGGISGGIQAFFTGTSIRNGIMIGGVFEGILSQLPPSVTKWIVPGENKGVENAFLEIAEEAFFSAIKGGTMTGIETGNIVDGIIDGALYGAFIQALPRILFYGSRYDAAGLISEEQIAEYNELHNSQSACRRYSSDGSFCTSWSYIMRDRYGDSLEVELKLDDLKRYTYRKGGIVWAFIKDRFAGFYMPLDGQISMHPDYVDRPSTILHEGMHVKQHEVAGYFYFLASPISGFGDYLNGGRVTPSFWEEYIMLPNAMLPSNFGGQILAIPVFKTNGSD